MATKKTAAKKKAPAKKAPVKKAPAKKAPAKKTATKKAPSKKAPAKKPAGKKNLSAPPEWTTLTITGCGQTETTSDVDLVKGPTTFNVTCTVTQASVTQDEQGNITITLS